ncbi:hypothetical protein L0222_19650 [bacterium]|nr:hypothetical protein [bacterium]
MSDKSCENGCSKILAAPSVWLCNAAPNHSLRDAEGTDLAQAHLKLLPQEYHPFAQPGLQLTFVWHNP